MANTSTSYIRSDGWQPHGRVKQYQGGHDETWGGVRINIDRNYLDLRTPRLPGSSARAGPGPADDVHRPALHRQLARRRPVHSGVDQPHGLPPTSAARGSFVIPLQCLLKQQRLYRYEVTGTWNSPDHAGLQAFQARVGHPRARLSSPATTGSACSRGQRRHACCGPGRRAPT